MGAALAGRLLAAGYPLTVWNRTPGRAEPLLAQGAQLAASPRALAETSDLILTILTDDAAIGAVYDGADGLLSGAVSGRVFVEMSTVRTSTIAALAERVRAAGAALVDAPISGTVGPARQGQLLALVGGAEDDVARVRPALETFCRRIAHVGPSGSGTAMKLALNLPMAIYWQGLAEALALGSQHGLDLATMLDLIADSPAAIGALRAKIPAILGDVGEVAFDVTGVRKDLLAMIESGQRVGVPMPAASAALISFMAATAAGRGGDDLAALIPHYLAAVRATTTPRE
jgi:3-hydroxyisobutyrate dehydrogenase-like beta-hydroxyacid dehydrogenase